jgi:hypothetical protein
VEFFSILVIIGKKINDIKENPPIIPEPSRRNEL